MLTLDAEMGSAAVIVPQRLFSIYFITDCINLISFCLLLCPIPA